MAKPVILTVDDQQVLRVMGRDTDGRKRAGFVDRLRASGRKHLGMTVGPWATDRGYRVAR